MRSDEEIIDEETKEFASYLVPGGLGLQTYEKLGGSFLDKVSRALNQEIVYTGGPIALGALGGKPGIAVGAFAYVISRAVAYLKDDNKISKNL